MGKVGFKFDLGQKVKDTVTGLDGIITAQHRWMTGCATYTVQPPMDKDGKVPESTGVDEVTLELVEEGNPPECNPVARMTVRPGR